jgi:hypothetical protein
MKRDEMRWDTGTNRRIIKEEKECSEEAVGE